MAGAFLTKTVSADDKFFVGLGPEFNENTRHGVAFGGVFHAGMNFTQRISFGVKVGCFYDFESIIAVDPSVFFRYYIPIIEGLFVQAEAGSIIFFEDGESYPAVLGGLAAGWHYNFGKKWYLEPFVRSGYPHLWGVGVVMGLRFNLKKEMKEIIEE